MNILDSIRVYVAVVESGGFSTAPGILGMPLPTDSRKISELERHLDTQLLVRSTRKLTVTETGQNYYEKVCNILEQVAEAEANVSGNSVLLKGKLIVGASSVFGRMQVLPLVNSFLLNHLDAAEPGHTQCFSWQKYGPQSNTGRRINGSCGRGFFLF